jgi:hypothetical protein
MKKRSPPRVVVPPPWSGSSVMPVTVPPVSMAAMA